jgi:hypothetical protein
MSMQDAFQYFTRMAHLVAQDSVPGEAPLAAPKPKSHANVQRPVRSPRHPGGLIRIVRTRVRSLLPGSNADNPNERTSSVVPFLAAADIDRAKDAAA